MDIGLVRIKSREHGSDRSEGKCGQACMIERMK